MNVRTLVQRLLKSKETKMFEFDFDEVIFLFLATTWSEIPFLSKNLTLGKRLLLFKPKILTFKMAKKGQNWKSSMFSIFFFFFDLDIFFFLFLFLMFWFFVQKFNFRKMLVIFKPKILNFKMAKYGQNGQNWFSFLF